MVHGMLMSADTMLYARLCESIARALQVQFGKTTDSTSLVKLATGFPIWTSNNLPQDMCLCASHATSLKINYARVHLTPQQAHHDKAYYFRQ